MIRDEVWQNIHELRRDMVTFMRGLTPEQWASPSWCSDWTVQQTCGHMVATAEQTKFGFVSDMIANGFKFDAMNDRQARGLGALGPRELIERLDARTNSTNAPPGPVAAMLGEIVVHGEDVRGALGVNQDLAPEVLVAVAQFYAGSNLIVGTKRRIQGVTLVATDVAWRHGSGPQVSGMLVDLVMAMTGRKQVHGVLTGAGVAILAARP
jgi:uncharacterized protein (TIGR03083 family)